MGLHGQVTLMLARVLRTTLYQAPPWPGNGSGCLRSSLIKSWAQLLEIGRTLQSARLWKTWVTSKHQWSTSCASRWLAQVWFPDSWFLSWLGRLHLGMIWAPTRLEHALLALSFRRREVISLKLGEACDRWQVDGSLGFADTTWTSRFFRRLTIKLTFSLICLRFPIHQSMGRLTRLIWQRFKCLKRGYAVSSRLSFRFGP